MSTTLNEAMKVTLPRRKLPRRIETVIRDEYFRSLRDSRGCGYLRGYADGVRDTHAALNEAMVAELSAMAAALTKETP